MLFELEATAGAPGDPITRVEWDFDADGTLEFAGPLGPGVLRVAANYRDAGPRNLRVRVRDRDSETEVSVAFNVREITLRELAVEVRV